MGNVQCFEEIEYQEESKFIKGLNKINMKVIQQLESSDMKNFHQNIVAMLIRNCRSPDQIAKIQHNNETRLELCQRIKLIIGRNQQSFFNLLIANYFLYYRESNSDDENIGDFILQFDAITQMLYLTVKTCFELDFKIFFGNDIDKLPDQELLIQRILQHYLLGKISPLKNQFNKLVNIYYSKSYDQLSQSNIPEKGTVLESNDFFIDKALLPISGPQLINMSTDSFLESSGGSYRVATQQSKVQIKEILETTSQQYKDAPYSQTFEILHQMVNTPKPWKKFLLIQRFDILINKTFLTNRHQDELNNLQELILAEDSRSDIYLYILQQLSQKQQYEVNFREDLLDSLKLMWEFDGLLSKDVKYIHCPSFLRFTNILEMYIQYNEQLQQI